MKRSLRALTAVASLILLAAVFYLYTQPDFLVQMANQLWACF